MKNLYILLLLAFTISCNTKRPEPNFYKNGYTGEILNKSDFEDYRLSIYTKYLDSVSKPKISFNFYKIEKSSDSIIQNFKYDIRIGDAYIIRSKTYEKIGMQIQQEIFTTIDGEKISVGGNQSKPTLINLWFIQCPGCIAVLHALNRLKEKYEDKVNFVSLTFEQEDDVRKFLKKRKFNFTPIVNVQDFINKIGSYPYPENIFVDKNGYITHIEGPLPSHLDMDVDTAIEYFEDILKKIL
ncbi:MAG: TlpA disulfide reductase family protein [Winogradskyella sp.]